MSYIIGSRFKKLEWLKERDRFAKPWVSRKYEKDGQITHDLRCDICGKWYNYSTKDIPNIISENRWNKKLSRPCHCGNSLCQDYYERQCKHLWKMAIDIAREAYPHAFMKEKLSI